MFVNNKAGVLFRFRFSIFFIRSKTWQYNNFTKNMTYYIKGIKFHHRLSFHTNRLKFKIICQINPIYKN